MTAKCEYATVLCPLIKSSFLSLYIRTNKTFYKYFNVQNNLHKNSFNIESFSVDSDLLAVINQHRKMSAAPQVHGSFGEAGYRPRGGAHSVHARGQRVKLSDASVLDHRDLVVLHGKAVGDGCRVAVPESRVYVHRSSCQVLLKHLSELHGLSTQQGHGVLHRQTPAPPCRCVIPHVSSHMNLKRTFDTQYLVFSPF